LNNIFWFPLIFFSSFLSRVEIKGNYIFSQNLLEKEVTSRYIGSEVSKNTMESLITELLRFYEDHGLPLAKIYPETLETIEDSSILILKIEEGPIVVVNDIEFYGIRRTRKKTILKLLAPLLQKPFDGKFLRREISNLKEEGAVEIDSIAFIETDYGYTLLLFVSNEAQNSIGGIISATSRYQPVGKITLNANNLWGTLRRLNISWRRISLGEQELNFTYREPWISGHNIFGELTGNYFFKDSLFSKKEASLLLGKRFGSLEYAIGIKKFNHVDFVKGVKDRGESGLFRLSFKKTHPEMETHFDLKGEIISSLSKISFDGGVLWKLTAFSIGPGIHVDRISSQKLNNYDLFPVGGKKTLRGFPDAHFYAIEDYIGRLEFSSIMNLGIFAFTEAAYIKTRAKAEKPIDYGFGVRGYSFLGTVEIAFAFVKGLPLEDGIVTVDVEKSF